MKFYHSNKLNILLLCGFLIQSCEKVKVDASPANADQYSFSRHALEYVHLPVGKYLIYKDSASSQLDSVIVTTSRIENIFVPDEPYTWSGLFLDGHPAYYHETFNLILTRHESNQQHEWFNGKASAYAYGSTPGRDTAYVNLISEGSGVFYCSESDHSDLSMSIEGKMYHNVIEHIYENGSPTSPQYMKTIYYWSKPVGLIKRTVIKGTSIKTYTLLRNN